METQGEFERSGLLPPCTSSIPTARINLKILIPEFFLRLGKWVRLLKGDKFVHRRRDVEGAVSTDVSGGGPLPVFFNIGGRISAKGMFFGFKQVD